MDPNEKKIERLNDSPSTDGTPMDHSTQVSTERETVDGDVREEKSIENVMKDIINS